MSTIGYENWAVDLADVGAIYPFQGWELLMVILAVVFWLAWTRIQFVRESEELKQAEQMTDKEKILQAIDRY
ncbi:MAG TPA: hypothetical protein EYP35_11220 [Desulfobacterales bacterium]|nr:hypothetical protein [Desulfobacterales bacterium]